MKYTIKFKGKHKGAIGIFQNFTQSVEAENPEKAILKLYDKYDHVHFPKIFEENGVLVQNGHVI